MVDIWRRSDGSYAVDYGKPGPFIVLTGLQMRGLVIELARHGIIRPDGYPGAPAS